MTARDYAKAAVRALREGDTEKFRGAWKAVMDVKAAESLSTARAGLVEKKAE